MPLSFFAIILVAVVILLIDAGHAAQTIRIPLTRRSAFSNDRQSVPLKNYQNSAFSGNVSIGTPPQLSALKQSVRCIRSAVWLNHKSRIARSLRVSQTFVVQFDTGSSDLWVPSVQCTLGSCPRTHRYDPSASTTYVSNGDNFHIEYEVDSATGHRSQDTVALGGIAVTSFLFAEVLNMSAGMTSGSEKYDGIMGLGFPRSGSPYKTVFQAMLDQGVVSQPVFSFYLDLNLNGPDGGELLLGGADPKYYSGNFAYSPVVTPNHEWQVAMTGVTIGTNTVGCIGGCRALIDSGNTAINGPRDEVNKIMSAIGATKKGKDNYVVDCSTVGSLPNITFTLDGGVVLPLSPQWYINPDGCQVMFDAVKPDKNNGFTWTLGDFVMGAFYVQFDVGQQRIGFASLGASAAPPPPLSAFQA